MSYRLTRICAVLWVFGNLLVLGACGDDKSASEGNVATAGTTAAGRGSAGVSGRNGSAGTGTTSTPMSRGSFGGQMCPMTEAEATGACTPARGSCMFGERTCDCSSETMTWSCWAPSDCPTTVPAEQSACSVVGMSCEPDGDTDCDCTAQGWDCGNQFCPPAEPALASACEGGSGQCTYGTRTCDCEDSGWVCWDPAADCPAVPPLDRAACPLVGVVCPYDGGRCECNDNGWRCGRGVDNDPEDAGVGPGPGDNAAGVSGTAAGAGAAGVSGAGSAGMVAAGTGAGTGGAP